MWTGVQFTGSLGARASQRWFTHGWSPDWHVIWYVVPTSPRPGAPELEWNVAVERASPTSCTYWIKVTNLSTAPVSFEARYAVLS